MKELIRLLYLVVVVLPLALLLIGPLLTLAALRGKQKIGPIVLDPSRRGVAGRLGAFLLGLLVWLMVWGGLAVLLSGMVLPAVGGSSRAVVQVQVTPTLSAVIPTSTSILAPSATATSLPTATPQPTATLTATQEEVPTSTLSPAPIPSATPSSPPPTSTPALVTATATGVPPTSAPLPTATFISSPTPMATVSSQEETAALEAVEVANELLRAAVVEPSIGNLAALETLWRGDALAKAQAFAQDLSQRYLRPLEVTFVYLAPPLVLRGSSPDTAFVISSEAWTYTGPRVAYGESFEFTYTLRRQDEGWVITDYAYGNTEITLSSPEEESPTAIPTPVAVTVTAVITQTAQ